MARPTQTIRLAVAARTSIALLVVSAATAACGANGERPAMTLFPDMLESVPHDAFEANPVSANGSTLLPPDGSVAINAHPFPFAAGEPEAIRAGLQLRNPLPPTPENLARGQQVFTDICQVCHGPAGQGDGPIIGRFPNPPSLTGSHTRTYADGRIYHVISRGQGIMPSHAVQVLPEDRWRLVLYVHQLQQQNDAAAQAPDRPDDPAPQTPTAPGAEDSELESVGGAS